jgi:hypothetical protein
MTPEDEVRALKRQRAVTDQVLAEMRDTIDRLNGELRAMRGEDGPHAPQVPGHMWVTDDVHYASVVHLLPFTDQQVKHANLGMVDVRVPGKRTVCGLKRGPDAQRWPLMRECCSACLAGAEVAEPVVVIDGRPMLVEHKGPLAGPITEILGDA